MTDVLAEMPLISQRVRYLMLIERLPVFPCLNMPGDRRDKTPAHKGWQERATRDPEDIELYAWNERDFLIGVPTGPASGIAIIDVDPRNGGQGWYDTHRRKLPETRVHKTGSGGVHLLFRVTDGTIKNTQKKIAPGIDTRGVGGLFIYWPAHPERGGAVIHDMPFDEIPPWPDWLMPEPPREPTALMKARMEAGGINSKWRPIASIGRVATLVDYVRNMEEGNRNGALHWAACRLGEMRFMRESQLDRACTKLLQAGVDAGLDVDAATKTIVSGLRSGSGES